MPRSFWGSLLYMATYFPFRVRQRRWQYSWPMELTPKWYTHPEQFTILPLLDEPFSDPSRSSPSEIAIDLSDIPPPSLPTAFQEEEEEEVVETEKERFSSNSSAAPSKSHSPTNTRSSIEVNNGPKAGSLHRLRTDLPRFLFMIFYFIFLPFSFSMREREHSAATDRQESYHVTHIIFYYTKYLFEDPYREISSNQQGPIHQ